MATTVKRLTLHDVAIKAQPNAQCKLRVVFDAECEEEEAVRVLLQLLPLLRLDVDLRLEPYQQALQLAER